MFSAQTAMDSGTDLSSSSQADSARVRLVQDLRIALRRSGHAELRRVDVNVDGDRIVILGQVPSFYLKQLCQELARVAAPEHEIDNRLGVLGRAR